MPKTLLALRHVAFEDLGSFAPVLVDTGYDIRILEAGTVLPDPIADDLVVVLGGPVGVHETAAYPFLLAETDFLRARLAVGRPTLGLCLGAQLIAASLGTAVRPMGMKEIGFAPVTLTPAGAAGPLRHLDGVPMLHWHGDSFGLPPGARHLACTAACPHQAFAIGDHVLGLQFHPEAEAPERFEAWLVGHACELAAAGLDPAALRRAAALHGPGLRRAGQAMLGEWLGRLPA